MTRPQTKTSKPQSGGTLLPFITGLVVGLAVALAAAVYVTRASLPFMNRFAPRPSSAASGAADWNPNKAIAGASAPTPADGGNVPADAASAPLSPKALAALGRPAPGVLHPGVPQAPGDKATPGPAPAPAPASHPAPPSNVQYVVQIGAYGNRTDAESQRAKVALSGLEAHIDERQVGGQTLYRVRVGPFAASDQADKAQKTLKDNGIESAMVKIPR